MVRLSYARQSALHRHESRLRAAAALTIAVVATAPAIAQPTFEVTASDPARGGELRVFEPLYVRLRYSSSVPLRFQAHGYREGKEVTKGERMNPAPTYPAGDGTAIAWIGYDAPEFVEEVRVVVSDANWQAISDVRVPIDMTWRTSASSPRDRADWVAPLNDAQQRMTSVALKAPMEKASPLWNLLPFLMFWSVPGYVWLQVRTWRRWDGGWRLASKLPLALMLPVVVYTLFALVRGSNLWPLVLLFAAPCAFAYLTALAITRRLVSRHD
jgi:hypothetical protein